MGDCYIFQATIKEQLMGNMFCHRPKVTIIHTENRLTNVVKFLGNHPHWYVDNVNSQLFTEITGTPLYFVT